jgi:spore coat polysaccharide biosynthesis protein SpsF
MRIGIVIQARTQSTRLPGKVLAPIGSATLLERLTRRMMLSRQSCALIVATGDHPDNRPIASHCRDLGVTCVTGSEEDCLSRIVLAAHTADLDGIVRVTADNPLTDPDAIDEGLWRWQAHGLDYLDNINGAGSPHGTGFEIIGRDVLEFSHATWNVPENREHVTWAVRRHLSLFAHEFLRVRPEHHRPHYRLSVDYPEDLAVVTRVYHRFGWRDEMRQGEIIAYLDGHRDVAALNAGLSDPLIAPETLRARQQPVDGATANAWAARRWAQWQGAQGRGTCVS